MYFGLHLRGGVGGVVIQFLRKFAMSLFVKSGWIACTVVPIYRWRWKYWIYIYVFGRCLYTGNSWLYTRNACLKFETELSDNDRRKKSVERYTFIRYVYIYICKIYSFFFHRIEKQNRVLIFIIDTFVFFIPILLCITSTYFNLKYRK